MPQMSTGQARVVDAVLSTAAQGYQNADFVYSVLFPVVPVAQRGGKIICFGTEAFRLYNTGRVPGQNTKRIQIGHAGAPYVLEQHALEGVLPIELQEEAEASTPGFQAGAGTVMVTQDIIQLRAERAAAAQATNPDNFSPSNRIALGGSSRWSDPASTPSADIEKGKEVVRSQIGRAPDTAVLSPKAFAACASNPSIADRIKYTGRDSVTVDLLASLWGLKQVAVAEAVYEDSSGALQDVWGDGVVLAYTALGSAAERGRPTFGYTYRLNGYPLVEQPYFDRPSKSWIYPVTDELQPVFAGASAGYLILGAA